MDSSSQKNLHRYLLEHIDCDPSAPITGVSEFREADLNELIYLRVLSEVGLPEEVICHYACGEECNLRVAVREKDYFLCCPRGKAAREPISKEEIRQFHIDLAHFARQLCSANGIACRFNGDASLTEGIFLLGEKDIGAESVTFILALGLNETVAYSTLLNIRTHLKEGRVIVLTPSFVFDDLRELNHLRSDYIYPASIIDLLEYPNRFVLDSNRLHNAIVPKTDNEKEYTLFIDTRKRIVLYKNRPVTLKPTAYELLLYFARHPQEVIERNTIYEMFWPQPMNGNDNKAFVNDSQVDDHVNNIRGPFRKLCETDPEISLDEINALIETMKRVGFRLTLEGSEILIV